MQLPSYKIPALENPMFSRAFFYIRSLTFYSFISFAKMEIIESTGGE
jgi:hypothetical protein